MSTWGMMIMIIMMGGIKGEKMEEVRHFAASTDSMIEKYSQQNPQAAQDYEEVMGELMRDYEEARVRYFEDAKVQREGGVPPKRKNPEYDNPLEEVTMYRELDEMYRTQHEEARAKKMEHERRMNENNNKNARPPSRRQETEREMEIRLRAEYNNRIKHETPEEMEARLRAKIEGEMFEKKEEVAQRQWKEPPKTNTHKKEICLPGPLESICGLNVFFTAISMLVLGQFVWALFQPSPLQKQKKVKRT